MIASARRLLKNLPPAKITHADLSREAQVDPKLIKYYFGDTSTLLTEVIMQIAGELSQRREPPAGVEAKGIRARLHARLKALIEILSENPHLHEMLLQRVVYGEAAESGQIEILREELMMKRARELDALLAEGVAAGEIRSVDSRYLYIAIIGMCEYPVNAFPVFGLLFGEGAEKSTVLEGYVNFLTDLIYSGLATRAPTTDRGA